MSWFWTTEHFSGNKVMTDVAQVLTTVTPISVLVRAPEKYDGTMVHIYGKPVPYLKLAGLGIGGFVVEDDEGNRIVILTKNGSPVSDPTTGRVSVIGVYKELFEIGTYSYPVIVAS